eukprot:NODE_787_length_1363_cov_251.363150.p2 GENE.NODE_787_length_1363_cov_251.363150~~NODE_787_length_1363_cov_251.363150.p2  ORF type:complete len:207 (-),score=65.44 NODE_787_length_1363_cov_251.363150:725-1345(-)
MGSKTIKKGFLNNNSSKGLYGPEGSSEGVLPENAGDPMGWMPKGLRKNSKIIDCNSPEYQEQEKSRREAEEHNKRADDWNNMLKSDVEAWSGRRDIWEADVPEGDGAAQTAKYEVDYSRFDKVADVEETAPATEERDWYYDTTGRRVKRNPQAAPKPTPQVAATAATSQAAEGESREVASKLKKGFLDDAKKPLYPRGSEEAARAE